MEEESKELVEIVVGKMLEPATDAVVTMFGAAGLDWLKEVRKRNADRFARKTKKILDERNVKDAVPPPPSILLPLLSAAEDEGREELLEIWARLMAAASDPAKLGLFRRDYIAIAKQLEPIDAVVLSHLYKMDGQSFQPSKFYALHQRVPVHADQLGVSLGKLYELGLTTETTTNPALQALGRQFMTILEP
jgi:hypothetical protein